MIDLHQLAMLSVFPLAALALGLWSLYLNRRGPERDAHRDSPGAADEIKQLEERVDRLNVLLRQKESDSTDRVRAIVVRNATTGQFKGAYRRASRLAAHRIPAE